MKFKGEYLNEKIWNVKGYNYDGKEIFEIKKGKGYIKEYNNGRKIIFEGEYLNGKRLKGKGKELNIHGILKYEGKYFFGKIYGKGKQYNVNGNLEYVGQFLDNERHGNGKEYYENGKLK